VNSGPDVPATVEEAVVRLRGAEVPAAVVEVARVIQGAGEQAVLVGGAVRDALMGLPHQDWDLATSATPAEVQGMFRRTIPTGIDHGTVTVLARGAEGARVPVEVTTFRGEGDYLDGRRPSTVEFHRDLVEDLARRDFTVNAFAWDPVRQVFTDPFGGLHDLQQRVIRAVGDPAARFAEDGLRTMRAVRFCATREFTLDPATHDAIAPALPVLAKVSRERVMVELVKLLEARKPSLGLLPMRETGMWPYVLPEIEPPSDTAAAIALVDRLPPRLAVRLAALLRPLVLAGRTAEVEAGLDALRPSRELRTRVLALVSSAAETLANATDPPAIRRAAAALGRAFVDEALTLRERDGTAVHAAIDDAPLTPKELAVKGGELIAAGLLRPGPAVSDTMQALLEWVLEDPTRNVPETLIAHAHSLRR
jgi:tRNA nucleotidyltransferase (CCA-adding enzyme)